jgi:hypothetical protein
MIFQRIDFLIKLFVWLNTANCGRRFLLEIWIRTVPNTVLLKRSWVEQNCQPKPRPGMDEGWSQVSETTFIEIWSDASLNKVLECLCFSTSVDFKAFFDKYFVVKCHLRVWKLLIEFNKVFKTGFASKIHTPSAEILKFFWNKVRRD